MESVYVFSIHCRMGDTSRVQRLPAASAEADALRAVIELTINGVSGGLKNTG